jgi:hypothetical protein
MVKKGILGIMMVVFMAGSMMFAYACGGGDDTGADGDADTDTDGDTDTDSDSDSDTDADTGTEDTDTGSSGSVDNYDSDQYGNPAIVCEPPAPNTTVLVSEVTTDTAGTSSAWVNSCMNRLGVQGAWYSYSDSDGSGGGTSTITMDYTGAAGADGKVCTSGTGGMVQFELYGTYWGTGLGVNICESGGDTSVKSTLQDCTLFDPRTKIIGFRITISGEMPVGGGQLRVQFAEPDRNESAYIVVSELGTADYLFADAAVQYAVDRGDTDVVPIHPELIESLQFQISTVVDVDTTFNFCVSDIQPILGD